MRKLPPLFICLSLLAACSNSNDESDTPFQPVLDMHDMMALILDPAAQVLWRSAGSEITDVEISLAPTTDEGWQEVINNAAIVAETGNLLMMQNRVSRIDGFDDDWYEYSQAIVETGKLSMAAAEARDDEALFDLGGQLYRVCVACHQKYMRPGDYE